MENHTLTDVHVREGDVIKALKQLLQLQIE